MLADISRYSALTWSWTLSILGFVRIINDQYQDESVALRGPGERASWIICTAVEDNAINKPNQSAHFRYGS